MKKTGKLVSMIFNLKYYTMKKTFMFVLILFTSTILFGQNNLKVVEYKLLKFETKTKTKTKTEFTVPNGQVWKIVSMIATYDVKTEIFINDEEYRFLYRAEIDGATDGLFPFYLPENTKLGLGCISGAGNKALLNIEVLKIE